MTEEVVPKTRYVLLKMSDRSSYLIGQLIEETQSEVILYYPILMSVYSDEQGTQILTSKYFPFANEDLVAIVKTSIHAIATPKQKFIKHYLQFIKSLRDGGLEQLIEDTILNEQKEEKEALLDEEVAGKTDTIH